VPIASVLSGGLASSAATAYGTDSNFNAMAVASVRKPELRSSVNSSQVFVIKHEISRQTATLESRAQQPRTMAAGRLLTLIVETLSEFHPTERDNVDDRVGVAIETSAKPIGQPPRVIKEWGIGYKM
jgi:hypothetical protein